MDTRVTFTVSTASRNDNVEVDRKTAEIERYLYSPFYVTGTEYDPSVGVLRVFVAGRYEGVEPSRVDYLVQYQRDRFASGMFPTTEPEKKEKI